MAVLVGTVTDDVRLFDVPKLRVCALRFTKTARARIIKVGVAGWVVWVWDGGRVGGWVGARVSCFRGIKLLRQAAHTWESMGVRALFSCHWVGASDVCGASSVFGQPQPPWCLG